MEKHNLIIAYTEYSSNEELNEADKQLLQSARKASDSAYAPYSGFRVGAALLLENGLVVTGNNQENGAYPSGLCAERVAAFAASSQYPGVAIATVAIVASTVEFKLTHPVTPCGGCRQVLAEYESLSGKPIRILMQGSNGMTWSVEGVKNLLPLMFQGEQLKK